MIVMVHEEVSHTKFHVSKWLFIGMLYVPSTSFYRLNFWRQKWKNLNVCGCFRTKKLRKQTAWRQAAIRIVHTGRTLARAHISSLFRAFLLVWYSGASIIWRGTANNKAVHNTMCSLYASNVHCSLPSHRHIQRWGNCLQWMIFLNTKLDEIGHPNNGICFQNSEQ